MKVALNKKKIASLVVHIDWYLLKILCMLLPFVQRYKKFLKKTNILA